MIAKVKPLVVQLGDEKGRTISGVEEVDECFGSIGRSGVESAGYQTKMGW